MVTETSLSQKTLGVCHLVVSRKFLQRLTEFQGWTKKSVIFFALVNSVILLCTNTLGTFYTPSGPRKIHKTVSKRKFFKST